MIVYPPKSTYLLFRFSEGIVIIDLLVICTQDANLFHTVGLANR